MDHHALAERWHTFDVSANIYEVDSAIEPLDDLLELARRAGLEGVSDGSWNEIGPLLEIEHDSNVFTVYRPSRAVQCIDSARWQVDDGVSTMEISDEDAIAAALEEVNHLELVEHDIFRPFRVTRLNVASAEKEGISSQRRVVDIGVVLSRVIDELPVEGQGGNIVMYLDTNLQITGFQRIARRVAGVHEPVHGWRPLDDVLSEVETYWEISFDSGLTVEDARLGYLELGRLEKQEFIQPVYGLSLRLSSQENDEVRTVEHYVTAATNGIGALMPSDSGPASQGRSK